MANETIERFARRLLRATVEGDLEWSRVRQSDARFTAKAGSGSVVIQENDNTSTELLIRDSNQKVIETLTDEPDRPGAWRPWEETLHELFKQARLSGMGTTELLGKLADEWDLPPDPEEIPF